MTSLPLSRYGKTMWVAALLLTLGFAVHQRKTGPTHPLRGHCAVAGSPVRFRLLRSATCGSDAPVVLDAPDRSLVGRLRFRRYRSHDGWTETAMRREGDRLVASLPHQPAAGKVMYQVFAGKDGQERCVSGDSPVILRYKGAVPAVVLVPHILFMFLAMVIANRAGLEALDAEGKPKPYLYWTLACLIPGGFVFGPIVQKYAFGAYWTGWPFGTDLTDNKAAIALVAWLWAWFRNRGERSSHGAVLAAAIVMAAVYLIPHSLLGSELDYTKLPAGS